MKTKGEFTVLQTIALAAVFLLSTPTKTLAATVLDLTTAIGATGTIDGAIFTAGSVDTATGTGVFEPFLRIQNSPLEEGFNTDSTPMPDVKTGVWTHEVQLSSLTVATIGEKKYVQLALDIGEPSNQNKSKLSIVDLRVYVRDNVITDASNTLELFATPNGPLFAFSEGDRIDLDYNLVGSGNGRSDMFFYLPTELFTNFEVDDYFYLYSKLGANERTSLPPYPSNGSFEEWAVITSNQERLEFPEDPVPIPEPTSLFFGIALAVVAGFGRARIC